MLEYPLHDILGRSAIVKLRARILEVLVRLAQSMEEFPKGVVYAVQITDTLTLVNGSSFSNIYRGFGNGKWLALKETRYFNEAPEMLVRVLADSTKHWGLTYSFM